MKRKSFLFMIFLIQVLLISSFVKANGASELFIDYNICPVVKHDQSQLVGDIRIEGNVFKDREEDTFIQIGFSDPRDEEEIIFNKVPQVTMNQGDKVLKEGEDFIVTIEEGNVIIRGSSKLQGKLEIKIEQLQVYISDYACEGRYHLNLKENVFSSGSEQEIQEIYLVSGRWSFGGIISFTANVSEYSMYGETYHTPIAPYIDKITNQMMVPIKIVMEALGEKEEWMEYSQGEFKVYLPNAYTFTVNSNKVNYSNHDEIVLKQNVILKNGHMYIALEDLAKVFSSEGKVKVNTEDNQTRTLIVPVKAPIICYG